MQSSSSIRISSLLSGSLAKLLLTLGFAAFATGCAVTSIDSTTERIGDGTDEQSMMENLASNPKGPIRFQKIVSADWAVDRGGLINLDHPAAEKAGLESGLESIQIYFYVVDHPTKGRFLIDTGMGSVFQKPSEDWPVSGMVQSVMNMDLLKIHTITSQWLKTSGTSPKGIFLTHMHLDHILGSGDIDPAVPFYVGPKESTDSMFLNVFVQGSTDDILGSDRILRELEFPVISEDAKNNELRILDFFGDGSLYVLLVPGHTAGSMAFLIRSTDGLQMVVGDTCHTVWGWKNNVPPGSFTADQEKNVKSLNSLIEIANKLQNVKVHLGHQSL
tara:strand:+ start:23656 stop:24648 length:993 start_codon:yes stop_codon:yes gene_type:complete